MNTDVQSEHDLDRYDQVFNNPVLDILFGVDNGSALFLQFCDPHAINSFRASCFATLLEVRDFRIEQEAAAHPERVPDPPLAWFTPTPAEADRGNP